MVEEQGRWQKTRGGTVEDQVRLDALRGEIFARSGNPRGALPILEAVATDPLSDLQDWCTAANIAVATGDDASYERLSRICMLRFSSTVEGSPALAVVAGLDRPLMDESTLAIARGLMERADDGSTMSNLLINAFRAILAYREHRYLEAMVSLDRYLATPNSRRFSIIVADPGEQAWNLFLRAMLNAELGRAEEARQDYARARAQLNLAVGDKPGHDRGSFWTHTYQAETRQREAEALFQAKGIRLPEPDAK